MKYVTIPGSRHRMIRHLMTFKDDVDVTTAEKKAHDEEYWGYPPEGYGGRALPATIETELCSLCKGSGQTEKIFKRCMVAGCHAEMVGTAVDARPDIGHSLSFDPKHKPIWSVKLHSKTCFTCRGSGAVSVWIPVPLSHAEIKYGWRGKVWVWEHWDSCD